MSSGDELLAQLSERMQQEAKRAWLAKLEAPAWGPKGDAPTASSRASSSPQEVADQEALLDELNQARLRTLRPEDVSADRIAPGELVALVMRSLHGSDPTAACGVLLGFCAVPHPSWHIEDSRGQLQPGAFSDAPTLCEFLSGQRRYATLLTLHEWRSAGPWEFSAVGRKATQRLQVRHKPDVPWEDMVINLQRDPAADESRWLITSIFKAAGPFTVHVPRAVREAREARRDDPHRTRVPCAHERPGRSPQFAKGGALGELSKPLIVPVPGYSFYADEPATLFVKPPPGATIVGIGQLERGRNLPGTSSIAFEPAAEFAFRDEGLDAAFVGFHMRADGWGRTRCQIRFSDETSAYVHLYVLPPSTD